METMRFMPPSRFDHADFGTIVEVKDEDGSITLWAQVGKDREHPEWKSAPELFLMAAKDLVASRHVLHQFIEYYPFGSIDIFIKGS